jgi:branched-chain amino acid aminotransferase
VNRSFLYGDGFFETMRIMGRKIPLLPFHLDRAKRTAMYFEMSWNSKWNEDYFSELLLSQADDNQVVRLTFYRRGGGSYVPELPSLKIHTSYRKFVDAGGLFEVKPFDEMKLMEKLSRVSVIHSMVYPERVKTFSPISSFKTTSAIQFVKPGIFQRDHSVQELILLNMEGRVCEGLTSNIILFIDGKWCTPAQEEGPVAGTYLDFLRGFMPIADAQISTSQLKKAKFCLFVNAIHGIRRFELTS